MTTADVVVIGGGVVGLAIADAWLKADPKARIVVLEKEKDLGEHASGRNSGVLHAGFYYAPDSLKAQLTRIGNQQLRAFCETHQIPVRECGKVVVTRTEEELPALFELARRGEINGVRTELVNESELNRLEPLARTVRNALWSPTTSVADPKRVIHALARQVRQRGGEVLLRSEVNHAVPGRVMLRTGESFFTGHIINAAGLYADKVAHWFGEGLEYKMLPFKGLYWYLNWPSGRLSRHIYPVPDPRDPFLGVHFTLTANGGAKIGPTAIPAFWREQYSSLSKFNLVEFMEIAASYPNFILSEHHDVPRLIRDEIPKFMKWRMYQHASELVPSLKRKDLETKGKPGIRAQLYNVKENRLEMDFIVRKLVGSTHILNAVSPGWTTAMAVADYVVKDVRGSASAF